MCWTWCTCAARHTKSKPPSPKPHGIDGPAVTIGLPQDPGQAGKHQVNYLARRLAGYRIATSPETGAKTTRAAPVASQVEARNLRHRPRRVEPRLSRGAARLSVWSQGRPGRRAVARLHDADRSRAAGAAHLAAVPGALADADTESVSHVRDDLQPDPARSGTIRRARGHWIF